MTEIWPPAVVNAASARGTGQIPDKEDLMYVVPRDDLYLVPTAEVPVTNLHRDEIFEADQLPIRYAAYSPCFRREAGRSRQGHPRHPARPPVRQGRDGLLREAGGLRRGARVADRPGGGHPPAPRPGLSGPAHGDAGTWASSRPRSTTSKSGRPASSAGSRSARARTSATTRPAGWRSATGPKPGAKPELVHTLNGSGAGARPNGRRDPRDVPAAGRQPDRSRCAGVIHAHGPDRPVRSPVRGSAPEMKAAAVSANMAPLTPDDGPSRLGRSRRIHGS